MRFKDREIKLLVNAKSNKQSIYIVRFKITINIDLRNMRYSREVSWPISLGIVPEIDPTTSTVLQTKQNRVKKNHYVSCSSSNSPRLLRLHLVSIICLPITNSFNAVSFPISVGIVPDISECANAIFRNE